ncbi:outer membrane beta-barrel family protein [Mucilaginibacter sp.]|uniref:outer membrane beta-barrel family protein n=1 Tax=Mucilaginibacter sp. TaxID=1882438 RepID=UPI00260C50AE|nr:outer membrane beta-barrel family protein [Mucilaginibacter sp.]
MKNTGLFLLLIICSLYVNAQSGSSTDKGKISGKVTDAVTKAAVDYATVSIYKQGNTSPFNGASTDTKGNFKIDNIAPGEYTITVDFLGYKRLTTEHLVISNTVKSLTLGNIVLSPVQSQLKGVVITASAPAVENKIDKLVYNPANDLTAQGGAAIDVLRKVPMVTVDIDGNVELQGNANIRFLINGKPSSVFGASLTDALQTIPASEIKSIEVVTSPGAKYDANGTGGIINIILKDSKVQGVNGTVNLSAGTRRENGSVNLNIRKGNFGVNASFSGNDQINSTTINTNDNLSYNNTRDTSNHLIQKGRSAFTRGGYRTGLSFNWSITKKDELTASFGYNHFANHNSGITNQDQTITALGTNSVVSDLLSTRNSDSRFSGKYFDYSVDYKKTFNKENQELDILYTSSYGNNNSTFFQRQDFQGGQPSSGSLGNNPGKDHETDISIDYTQPVSKDFTIETGAKAVLENINNTVVTDTLSNGVFVPNANQTYGFNYNRKVYAYYLSASFSLFNKFIDGKAGLRDEYTSTTADFPGAKIPGYNILAPSAVLSHKIDETQSIKLSYTYRIERPDYGDLNPFYNISDPHNISTGNPNLRPEVGHNYELGYNKSFTKGGSLYVAAFYRYNTNDLQSYTTYYDTLTIQGTKYSNVYLNQRFNIGTEVTEGVSLFGSIPITKELNLRSNVMLGDRITTNPGNPTVSGFTYRINLNASYEFGNDFTAEAFGNYNSSQRTIQGTRPAFVFYNLAVRKQFMDKKISLGLTAADPFTPYVNLTSTTSGTLFNQTSIRQVPFRSFGITFSYKFGKLEFKKDKERDDNNVPTDNGG